MIRSIYCTRAIIYTGPRVDKNLSHGLGGNNSEPLAEVDSPLGPTTFYFCLVGVKGDWVYLRKAGTRAMLCYVHDTAYYARMACNMHAVCMRRWL